MSYYCVHNYHIVIRPIVFFCVECEKIGFWWQAVQGNGGYWSHHHKKCCPNLENHFCKEVQEYI